MSSGFSIADTDYEGGVDEIKKCDLFLYINKS